MSAFFKGLLKSLLVLALVLVVAALVYLPILSCVAEGTMVETPSGPRAIESLRPGDRVLSWTSAGGLAEGRVVATRASTVTWWRRLSLGGGKTLEVTATHPIATSRGFAPAGDLRAGDAVATGGGFVNLEGIQTAFGVRVVYDLSVEPYENFIASGVVVHNKRWATPESTAIGDCRAISSSEAAYSSSNEGAFGRPTCLANPTACGFAAGTTPFIDSQLASLSPRQGYARSFVSGSRSAGKPDPGIATFVYVATPVTVGQTGNRGFAVDHSGLICFTTDGSIPTLLSGGTALSPGCTPLK